MKKLQMKKLQRKISFVENYKPKKFYIKDPFWRGAAWFCGGIAFYYIFFFLLILLF